MADFLVADLNSKGELQLREPYSYEALERIPGAGDLIARCSGALWRTPEHFEIPLNPGAARLTLRWSASAPTAGMATMRPTRKYRWCSWGLRVTCPRIGNRARNTLLMRSGFTTPRVDVITMSPPTNRTVPR